MSHKARAIFLFLTIVAVMFASAVGTTNVYADDGTPPPPPTEAPAVDPSTDEAEPVAPAEPVEEAAATEAVVTEPEVVEPVATEPVVVEEAAPVVEEQQPAEEAAEVETILEQVPEDTTVVVLNAEGEAQPLTTQESADAILTGDPIWCPDYQDPTPGANGCTQSFSSFDALLSYLKVHEGEDAYKQDGKIYVQMGTYAGPETSIDFNTYGFASLNQYNLTVQGGWDTSGTDIVADNPTQLKVPIVVGTAANPWVGSLSFDGIKITNANGTGLTLYSAQDISLTNVEVTNSTGGASLDAGGTVFVVDSKFNSNKKFGAEIDTDGDVYVVNSEFNKNGYGQGDTFGLTISNRGSKVVLDNISASTNDYGADVNSTGIVTVRNSFFSGNIAEDCDYTKLKTCHCTITGGYGLHVVTTGVSTDPKFAAVNLDGVTANDNYSYGAKIEATDARIYNSTFIADKKTQGYGLEVLTTGGTGVKLDNVSASHNEQFGANISAGAFVEVKNSFFDGNASSKETCEYIGAKKTCHWECKTTYDGYGLQVVTTDGIALSNVSAQDNNLYGARLDGLSVGVSNSIFSGNGSFTGDDPNQPLTGKGLEVISDSNVPTEEAVPHRDDAGRIDVCAIVVGTGRDV
ncbi:MAG TPA: right-handed parallel beta-helix repeat-containing protein, partial [Anaerolineales bacterium]|nr:right-handed parallel beta-helix repeat-containing protein [Anaerolineales bacterium]